MGISRHQFMTSLGLVRLIDPLIEEAYQISEEKIQKGMLDRDPHGAPWHTSFHASQFPGDDPKSCDRQALYGLMDLPDAKPVEPRGRGLMDAGKAAEEAMVQRLHDARILLTAPPSWEHQTGWELPEIWLSGNTDAVIEIPGTTRAHVIEFKGKISSGIDKLLSGEKSYDPGHHRQLMTYIAMARYAQETIGHFPEHDPIEEGTLFYFDLGDPRNSSRTVEFTFKLDQEFFDKGCARLRERKDMFLDNILPPRPKEWRWTELPCKWCPVKKVCKEDVKQGIDELDKSTAIESAKLVSPDYDYEEARKRVKERWEDGT